jgi:hypothetical protein
MVPSCFAGGNYFFLDIFGLINNLCNEKKLLCFSMLPHGCFTFYNKGTEYGCKW